MQTIGEPEAQAFGLMIRNQRRAMGLRQEDVAPQQAARAVEILRDTGKCDWERAMSEETN